MSGILLSSSGATLTPTPRMDEELKKLLPAPPTTTRGFATVESIFGYADVYDSLQPAHSIDITTTVTRVDGTKVFTTTEERKSSEFGGGKGGGFGAQFEVPLKDFAPGLYVLKVEAKPRLDKHAGRARTDVCRLRSADGGHHRLGDAHRADRARSAEQRIDGARVGRPQSRGVEHPLGVAADQAGRAAGGLRPDDGRRRLRRQPADHGLQGRDHRRAQGRRHARHPVARSAAGRQGPSVNATVTTPFAVAGLPRHDGPVTFEKAGS